MATSPNERRKPSSRSTLHSVFEVVILVRMRVLVVEDDFELGSRLQNGLREQGYSVDRANRLQTALTQASTGHYDLLIVDRMLPGGDGLGLLTEIRAIGVRSAVIFLTARGDVRDRVAGLDAGADDYLVKPFSFPELLARMRVVARRGSEEPTNHLHLDDLRLDVLNRKVERAGQAIELSTKEFLLLKFLMNHAGHVVSRGMILEHVWNLTCGGMTNVVDVHITRLRKKIDRDFSRPLIHTIRGVGYVIRANS
jgi:two-component system, OmpR family, response regulator